MGAISLDQSNRLKADSPRANFIAALTPARCRWLMAAMVMIGFVARLFYLRHLCPFDLTGDEAQYWDWSRQLDWSYYSKGPLVAWIIRGSCSLFGDFAWAVRLPALALSTGASVVAYWLTWRLFDSDRLALAVVALSWCSPLFVAGGLLMTIDPPFYFCWALAVAFTVRAVFDESRTAWIGVAAAVGIGFLAKYAMLLYLPIMLGFLAADKPSRRWLATAWPWAAVAVALLFMTPVILWNHRHGWVSLRHVSTQTGATGGRLAAGNFPEFFASQVGIVNPLIFVTMIAAAIWAIRGQVDGVRARAVRLLMWAGLPFFGAVALTSLRTKAQANWAGPAYFSMMILAVYFLSTRRDAQRRSAWGIVTAAAITLGLIALPLMHDFHWAHLAIQRWNSSNPDSKAIRARAIDPTVKFSGYGKLGQIVGSQLAAMPNAFVIAEDYQTAAELAFYIPGQPVTFCAGSWFKDPDDRKRMSQYDVWPDRALDRAELVGRNALYVGYMNDDIRAAFDDVEGSFVAPGAKPTEKLQIERGGVYLRTFRIWRCRGFKGMSRPADAREGY